MIWLAQILQGVLLGGYYALVACGLSFMFSVMGVINLAHGSFAILAAFGLWALAEYAGISPLYGWVAILPAMALLGVLFQRLVLDRSTRAGFLIPVLSTFGLSICIDNMLFQQFGADTRSLAPFLEDLSYDSWELTDGVFIGKLAGITARKAEPVISFELVNFARGNLLEIVAHGLARFQLLAVHQNGFGPRAPGAAGFVAEQRQLAGDNNGFFIGEFLFPASDIIEYEL